MMRGNKGEWSELYVFLKLLTDRKIIAADEDLKKVESVFFPILKIIREEGEKRLEYDFPDDEKVRVALSGKELALVDTADLKNRVSDILTAIRSSSATTFTIPRAEVPIKELHIARLNAGTAHKEDLTVKIYDHITGTKPEVGFSIKSMLGNPATLLNASQATNFCYKISGLNKDRVNQINAIDTRSRIRDRLAAIVGDGGKFTFQSIQSDIFENNLRKIDTALPEMMSQLVLSFYLQESRLLPEIVENLKEGEMKVFALQLGRAEYEIKIKNLLYNVALGMVPDTPWDGLTRASGGYIIVKETGELVCYHLYNADDFREYIYRHTRLETPSSSRHGSGFVYKRNGELFINLTLQIRFTR